MCQLHQPGLHAPGEVGLHPKGRRKDGLPWIRGPAKQPWKDPWKGGMKPKITKNMIMMMTAEVGMKAEALVESQVKMTDS